MQAWHRALLTRRRQRESGQVMVLFALALIVLVLAVGLAIDGGFGLLQYRQAQNAADFAAEAAAQALYPTCTATGNLSANELVYDINAVVATNSPSTDTGNGVGGPPFGWTGYYLASTSKPLKQAGSDIPIYSGTAYPGGNAPTGACGVHLDVSPQWPPFIAQILGVAQLKTATGASALNTAAAGSTATSIVALAENGAHTILMAGDGLFEVEGTIFDNSNGCLTSSSPQSINGGCDKWGSFSKPDILDGKQSGTMYDWGLLEYSSIVGAPWDSCFGTTPDTSVLPLAGPKEWPDPNPVANGDAPTNDAQCGANNTNVWSDYWQSGGSPKTSLSQISLPPAPTPNNAGCGGEVSNPATGSVGPTPANPPYPAYPAGTTVYYPGDYTNPVVITGNAVFYNCSQTDNITGADPPNPGDFYFDQGLVLRPGANAEVFGNDVLLATQNPIPDGTIASSASAVAGLDNGYHNVGDGEPTIGYGPKACTGTSTGESCSVGAATSSTSC
ncbi:MAG: TadE/TadG family type IV pilus assembly protein, partial [Candidatus Dormibacteria bacterium]